MKNSKDSKNTVIFWCFLSNCNKSFAVLRRKNPVFTPEFHQRKGKIMIQNNSSASVFPRSDLANECVEIHFGKQAPDFDGIKTYTETCDKIICDVLEITSDEGAIKLGKPCGKYMTLNVGKISMYTREDFCKSVEICAEMLSRLLPKHGSCLLACLGNRQITADAQGPLCADYFIVSRHIKDSNPGLFSGLSLAETMCVVPDVLGNTGIEAALIVKGVVDKLKPTFVIAVDSLAARKTARVGCTLQMSNAGIAPGSGVGNHRTALSAETLGVPVISIGVPTVVDAVTVGADILEESFSTSASSGISPDIRASVLKSVLESGSYGYFVTPKNADDISRSAARLIGFTINKALNPDLDISEMEELIG